MKRFLLVLTVNFLVFSTALSTEQVADILIIEEDTIYLQSFPLENLKIKQAPFDYGGYSFINTACWRGYVATWQIMDETLVLKEVRKLGSTDTILNVLEYLENNGYTPKTINGNVIADWYSDTLKLYHSFYYNHTYKNEQFYLSKDYSGGKDKKAELVFENGKLIENNITPISAYQIGDILCLDVFYFQNWHIWSNHKKGRIEGIIRENNGKKVRLEILSFGTDKERIKRLIQKEIKNSDNFWVNPRCCKNCMPAKYDL